MAGKRKRRERWTRWISLLVLALVAVLLVRHARSVDWAAVGGALAAYRPGRVAAAAGLGLLSYLLYAGYELAARAYVGHRLPTARVVGIALVSYAFNLNLGALVGGGGMRLRLYTRAGLDGGDIARIIAFTMATNWLGYLVLAGCVFAFGLVALPEGFAVGPRGARAIGVLLLAIAAAYLLACAFARDRGWSVRGVRFQLPRLSLAAWQLALSIANWLVIATVLHVLLEQRIAYPLLLGVVLLGAVAAAVTHIPAGLGALEAVFVLMLGSRLPQSGLLAALLAYRAIYYLAPLLLAVIAYLAIEYGNRKDRSGRSG